MAKLRRPEEVERLEAAVSRLRPLERQVLLLSASEGLRTGELAARLGITPRAAERLLAKALRKLDRALERLGRPWWHFW
jgi:RNA polymerase sigma factor (sigma-70 family)